MGRHRHLIGSAIVTAAVLAAGALAGCAAPQPAGAGRPAPAAKKPSSNTAGYQCAGIGSVTATFVGGWVRVAIGDRSILLPRKRSADGARFTDGESLFWDRGKTALIAVDGGPQRSCTRDD